MKAQIPTGSRRHLVPTKVQDRLVACRLHRHLDRVRHGGEGYPWRSASDQHGGPTNAPGFGGSDRHKRLAASRGRRGARPCPSSRLELPASTCRGIGHLAGQVASSSSWRAPRASEDGDRRSRGFWNGEKFRAGVPLRLLPPSSLGHPLGGQPGPFLVLFGVPGVRFVR